MRQTNIRHVLKWIVLLYLIALIALVYRVHDEGFGMANLVDKVDGILYNGSRSNDGLIGINTTARTHPTVTVSYRRYGPGEDGAGVNMSGINMSLPGLDARNKVHGFNTFISDMLSLHRKLPDMRPLECKKRVYPDNLPPISVVVIFRDEWWSILLRTVYSVLEMSPPKLLHEIILVDDGSTDMDLMTRVKIHVDNVDKLKLVRNEHSLGLMLARQTGINAVASDYFVVMDGHMEVAPGWLEPLIYRLLQKPKAMLCSHVGGVNMETFEYVIDNNRPEDKNYYTVFPFFDHTNLDQMFAEYSPEFRAQINHSVDPIPYGTIQGMMMAMRTDFFRELGGFDPGMRVWGSEQMEVSVKVWMCGGVVEMVPCSNVAHMFRITPWGKVDENNDFHSRNKARMVQVWMDPPYSDTIGHYLSDKNFTTGNLLKRHAIRTKNRCKPYQYFVDKIRSISNVFIPTKTLFRGNIQSALDERCIDIANTNNQLSLILYPCHPMVTSNQYFIITGSKQIRCIQGNILDVEKRGDEVKIKLRHSPSERTDGGADWNYDGNRLEHVSTGYCLAVLTRDTLGMQKCTNSSTQIWKWRKT